MPREAMTTGSTMESQVTLSLSLDGSGKGKIASGIVYFDHLLHLFAENAHFDITLEAHSDYTFGAHTVGTIGHCFGKALTEALGDKKGITRFASAVIPVDASLARVALDLSGRPHLEWNADIPVDKLGTFDAYLGLEFMRPFSTAGGINMHVDLLELGAPHHAFDAIFIAVGRALGEAVSFDPREKGIPSSKGAL